MVMVILMTKMMRFTGLRSWSLDTAMAMARVRRMKKMMRLTGLMKESIWRRSAERSHIKAYLTHTWWLCIYNVHIMYIVYLFKIDMYIVYLFKIFKYLK